MSHIPASAMPHAKPHDDAEQDAHGRPSEPETSGGKAASQTSAPADKQAGSKDASKGETPKPEKAGKAGAGSTAPFVAIAAVGALAIGGIVAALALHRPETEAEKPRKAAKGGKRKGRGHKADHEA